MVAGGMMTRTLPIFDGKGYNDWCMKMEVNLGF